jgi:hypothetical protein
MAASLCLYNVLIYKGIGGYNTAPPKIGLVWTYPVGNVSFSAGYLSPIGYITLEVLVKVDELIDQELF